MGIPEDAPFGVEEELWQNHRRHYIPWWLPEALAEITSVLYALGGVKTIDPQNVLDRWLKPETGNGFSELIAWMDRQGAETKTNGGEDGSTGKG